MIRKCIAKINSFIQWTKKWHYFHVLVWTWLVSGSFLALLNIDQYQDFLKAPFIFWGAIFFVSSMGAFFYVVLPITITTMLITYIKTRSFQVQNEFLLHNRVYHFFYCLYYITIPIILILLILTITTEQEDFWKFWLAPVSLWLEGW